MEASWGFEFGLAWRTCRPSISSLQVLESPPRHTPGLFSITITLSSYHIPPSWAFFLISVPHEHILSLVLLLMPPPCMDVFSNILCTMQKLPKLLLRKSFADSKSMTPPLPAHCVVLRFAYYFVSESSRSIYLLLPIKVRIHKSRNLIWLFISISQGLECNG